jgi:hypothetical protein
MSEALQVVYLVENSRAWYSPYWHCENEPETSAALDLIFSDHFSPNSREYSSRCARRCYCSAITICTSRT